MAAEDHRFRLLGEHFSFRVAAHEANGDFSGNTPTTSDTLRTHTGNLGEGGKDIYQMMLSVIGQGVLKFAAGSSMQEISGFEERAGNRARFSVSRRPDGYNSAP